MTLVWTLEMPPHDGAALPAMSSVLAMGGDAIISIDTPNGPQNTSKRQKVTLLNGNIAVAWAGTVSQIEFFLGYFCSELSTERLGNIASLTDLVARVIEVSDTARYNLIQQLQQDKPLADDEAVDVEYVGFVSYGDEYRAIGYHHDRRIGPFGIIGQAAGSGKGRLLDYLAGIREFKSFTQIMGHFHGRLLLEEALEPSLKEARGFGGFFELVTFDGGSFCKLDGVLTIIMKSTAAQPRPQHYARYCFQFYHGETLYACLFDTTLGEFEVQTIPALGSPAQKLQALPAFVPKYMLFMVLLFDENDQPYEHFQQLYAAGAHAIFHFPTEPFTMDARSGQLTMANWYLDGMEKWARQRLAAKPATTEDSDMVDADVPQQEIGELVGEMKAALGPIIDRNLKGKDILTHLPIVTTAVLATMTAVFVGLGRELQARSPQAYESFIRAVPSMFAAELYKDSDLPTDLK